MQGFYQKLEKKGEEKDGFRLAKARDKRARDLDNVRCWRTRKEEFLLRKEIVRRDGNITFVSF